MDKPTQPTPQEEVLVDTITVKIRKKGSQDEEIGSFHLYAPISIPTTQLLLVDADNVTSYVRTGTASGASSSLTITYNSPTQFTITVSIAGNQLTQMIFDYSGSLYLRSTSQNLNSFNTQGLLAGVEGPYEVEVEYVPVS